MVTMAWINVVCFSNNNLSTLSLWFSLMLSWFVVVLVDRFVGWNHVFCDAIFVNYRFSLPLSLFKANKGEKTHFFFCFCYVLFWCIECLLMCICQLSRMLWRVVVRFINLFLCLKNSPVGVVITVGLTCFCKQPV